MIAIKIRFPTAPQKTSRSKKVVSQSPLDKEKIAAEKLAKSFLKPYADDSLPFSERKEILVELSRQALDSILKIESIDSNEKRKGLQKCNLISYEILLLASASNNLLKEILTIRSFKDDLDHRVVVSSIGAMFALAIGITEKKDLELITIAGFLHDIGLSRIPPSI
jgi:HD-GYP domain-containing protein (c-di-GMP phosphodiesterase class II)